MIYDNRNVFQRAADVSRIRLLDGWTVRMFRRGAAQRSPIVILAPAATPPADPMTCSRLVPVPTFDNVYQAVAGAPEAAREPLGVAYVCGALSVAAHLIERFRYAGATPTEAVT